MNICKAMRVLLLVCVVGISSVSMARDAKTFESAGASAKIAGYSVSKVQRWLHDVALKKIEKDTGLYHPDGRFNYQDAWADCYPFLVWAAWLTDIDALNGPVRGALHAEIKHCPQVFFTDPKNTFGGSEYVKDGLIAIVEVTGKDEWFNRMKTIQDNIWAKPTIDTKYGKIPSKNIEINGEQLQALARMYTMTGDKEYLQYAERLADYYLLPGNFAPTRLRDHGCEIIGGLGLLLGVESVHNPAKAKQYLPHMKKMLDTILEKGTNEDGIMYNTLGRKGRLSDGWGYNYVGYLCYDMVAGKPVYRKQMTDTLGTWQNPCIRTTSGKATRSTGTPIPSRAGSTFSIAYRSPKALPGPTAKSRQISSTPRTPTNSGAQ